VPDRLLAEADELIEWGVARHHLARRRCEPAPKASLFDRAGPR